MKKVIVTGGLGFIGSHFVELLLAKNYEVIVIDNQQSSVVPPEYFTNTRCQIITKSISEVDFSKFTNIDKVYHFASILGPVGVLKFAGDIGPRTLNDTIKVRDYCLASRAQFIYISSSEIYGQVTDFREDANKVFPGEYQVRTEYGGAKLLSEICIVNKAKMHKISYQIIRPFNVAGPRQKPDGGFVLPRFVVSALSAQPLTIYGNGKQMRSFTHVLDICDAIYAISNCPYQNEVWNIGNPDNQMSILKMAKLVCNLVKSTYPKLTPKTSFVDPQNIHGPYFAEVPDKIPNIAKMSKFLKWLPKYGIDKIILDSIDYYKDRIDKGYTYKIT